MEKWELELSVIRILLTISAGFFLQESICKRLLTIDALMSLLYGMSPDKEADKVLKCL
jgi:hypothetical protein